MDPSIGNWSYACRSHYWIVDSEVVWSGTMSQRAIESGRAFDRKLKQAYFDAENRKKTAHTDRPALAEKPQDTGTESAAGLWWEIKRLWNKYIG